MEEYNVLDLKFVLFHQYAHFALIDESSSASLSPWQWYTDIFMRLQNSSHVITGYIPVRRPSMSLVITSFHKLFMPNVELSVN